MSICGVTDSPQFGLLVTSSLDFKARAGSALFTLGGVIPNISSHQDRLINLYKKLLVHIYKNLEMLLKKITWCILKTNSEEVKLCQYKKNNSNITGEIIIQYSTN